MKTSGVILSLLLALAGSLSAQITVGIVMDQGQFLPGEAIVASVCITNRSGQSLHLGADQEWLTFSVESREGGGVVLKHGEVPVVEEFTLNSSQRASRMVDLAPYFNLLKPGRYAVTATITIKEWGNQQFHTGARSFDIIEGAKLWEQEIGIPATHGTTNQLPEIRRYTLQQANHLRQYLMLYVRITDNFGKLNKVFPIGPMLSFGQPIAQVDRDSNLHVLYQSGPHSYNYSGVNPDGDLIIRQTFEMPPRPQFKIDDQGNLKVIGNRRVRSEDIPPPPAPDEVSAGSTNQTATALTNAPTAATESTNTAPEAKKKQK